MDDIITSESSAYYGTESIQEKLLELLVSFHRICVENEIRYSLNSGTLLGAIRHDGFIPWDDDADVMMERADYERFMKLDLSVYGNSILRNRWVNRFVRSEATTEDDAFIDIFVVDNVPDNKMVRSAKVFMIRTLQGMMKEKLSLSNYHFPYNILIWGTHTLGRLASDESKYDLYQKISKISNAKDTEYVGIYNNFYRSIPRLYDRDMMKDIILHRFEDVSLYITSRYDSYLSGVYGDYMTPPPKEDRISGRFNIKCNNETIKMDNSNH